MIVLHEKTTVSEFIKLEKDIDLYDDVCEELGVCFSGPYSLTQIGTEHFNDILNLKVDIYTEGDGYIYAVINIDDPNPKIWRKRLKLAKEMFEGMAGYINQHDYDKYFIEEWAK